MHSPLKITYRHMAPSPALETKLKARAEKLDTFHPNITGCRIVIEQQGLHKEQGRSFDVRLEVIVPRGDVIVNRSHDEDVFIAVRDAFDAAARQLEDLVREQRGAVKAHGPAREGRTARTGSVGNG